MYCINFFPKIEKYYYLYIKHSNLEGLCALEQMIYEELQISNSIKKMKNTNEMIIKKIKDILIDKISNNNIEGKK